MKLKLLFFFHLFALSVLINAQSNWIKNHLESDFYKNQFTGFSLYDPESKTFLESYNSDKFFTPASGLKILTLYSALKVLPDSIPALRYQRINGDLYIEGLGDPTFMHPEFKSVNKILDWLKDEEGEIYLHWGKFEGPRMGTGWSWEDYEKHYSAERSEFPINGNLAEIKKGKSGLNVFPMTLADSVEYQESLFSREFLENKFYIGSRNGSITKVPFVVKDELIRQMLSDLIGREIKLTDKELSKDAKILFSIPSDLVYKRMMEVSDNFLAEQLLLMVSGQFSNSMSTEKSINYIESKYFKNMPQKPVWVDGSGLSRYNLLTPEDLVFVLELLYKEIPHDKLFNLFAVGGKTGTLKSNYGGKKPYIYAKSGTLSNNYSLSGYLVTNSGKTLIFSMMNNHYTKQNWQVRQELQKLLEYVRDNY